MVDGGIYFLDLSLKYMKSYYGRFLFYISFDNITGGNGIKPMWLMLGVRKTEETRKGS